MKFINNRASQASVALANQKGAYPQSESECHNDEKYKPRNAARTTIAPTGTLSIIADCSSGIEPLIAIVYERNQADMRLLDVNPMFKAMILDRGIADEKTFPDLAEKILSNGTIQDLPYIDNDIKSVFMTAHDIAPEWHIKMQAAFQRHVNNAVSKTINFRHDATKEDVKRAFVMAYQTGCKGITTYRDGSRDEQVLSTGASYQKSDDDAGEMRQEQMEYMEEMARLNLQAKPQPRPRPDITTGFTEKVKTGCGNLYITVNYDERGICEVFTNNGRAGGCPSQSEAVSRLVSMALRTGISTQAIIDQLKGIRCSSTTGKGLKCMSCPDAIGRLIEKMETEIADTYEFKSTNTIEVKLKNDVRKSPGDFVTANDIDTDHTCPNCFKLLEHEGGCVICRNCGYSRCG
jgi:ribonucleoside-diphosphate reductase alpha chain